MAAGTFRVVLFDGENPAGRPATVTIRTIGLLVDTEKGPLEVSYIGLKAARGGYDNKMLVLSGHREGKPISLYFDDPGAAAALLSHRLPDGLAGQLRQAGKRSSGIAKALVWIIALGLLGWLAWQGASLGFHAAVGAAVEQIPPDLEKELGRQAALESLTQWNVCSAPPLVAAMDEIGKRLADSAGAPGYTFRFRVVDSPELNAFALPGGYVFVNFGLVEKSDSPEQVAGVLAHEIQHALRRHGLRNLIGQAGLGLVAALVFGDASGTAAVVAGLGSQLAALSFSREQEEEADRLGLALLLTAGVDPAGMPQFFEKLIAEEQRRGLALPSFLSTHPDTRARIAALEALIAEKGKGEARAFSADWSAARKECKPVPLADPDKELPTLP